MMRYIDADVLMKDIENSRLDNPHAQLMIRRNHDLEHRHFENMVSIQPTADVAEVIRCKDCKYYYEGITHRCTYERGLKVPKADAWCNYGERK